MFSRICLSVAFCALFAGHATAGVSADEAKLLGTKLTAFGAQKEGNADGAIPPYSAEGTRIAPPAGANPAAGRFPNPFAADKPLFSINQKNVAQYADKLDAGALAMIKKWPDFQIDVYKTRRTAPYPDWVLKNTVANATRASLVNPQGDGVEGAHGGIPFPIPKNGLEVLWNGLLSWLPLAVEELSPGYMVDASGSITNLSVGDTYYETQYYNPEKTSLEGPYNILKSTKVAPARGAGETSLIWYSINYEKIDQKTWSYSPGQRRVRLAPEFSYDTPAASYGGALFYDEIYGFAGRPDRFDWKLVGKKEIYVPYNNYDVWNAKSTDVLGPQHLKMDKVRYELHRVWEVEATLKPGARHAIPRKTLYFDEDSWKLLTSVGYDRAGEIYRVGNQYCAQAYMPTEPFMSCAFSVYDMAKNQYVITPIYGENGIAKHTVKVHPPADTTASGMQGAGVR